MHFCQDYPILSAAGPCFVIRSSAATSLTAGFVCLPPECQGVCSSYAQLATAAPAMLQSSKSAEVLRRRGSSPSLQRGESITSLGQDSAARRAKELLLLLQAGDVWCLGCAVHVLLCGQIPVVDPTKLGEQETWCDQRTLVAALVPCGSDPAPKLPWSAHGSGSARAFRRLTGGTDQLSGAY
eukprot:s4183_g2.t1